MCCVCVCVCVLHTLETVSSLRKGISDVNLEMDVGMHGWGGPPGVPVVHLGTLLRALYFKSNHFCSNDCEGDLA